MRRVRRTLPVLALALLGGCASLSPATLRLEPGASLRQSLFAVDSVRYEGGDSVGPRIAHGIGATLVDQLARRGRLAGDGAAGQRVVVLRASLVGYATGNTAVRLIFGPGYSPNRCVLRVSLVDRDTGRMVGEMVTSQSTGGRLTTPSKCAYSVADALEKAADARGGP